MGVRQRKSVKAAFPGSALLLFLSIAVLFLTQTGHGSAPQPLQFFTNYFVTGDYAVGGTSLWRRGVNGKATVNITMSGVPAGADVLAAFLYVQTAERLQWSGIDHAKFNGHDLGPGDTSEAKALVPAWASAPGPCWSVAWPGGRKVVTYRTDALRYVPVDAVTGKHKVNGTHTLEVPDAGPQFGDDNEGGTESSSSTAARAIGASLLVIYRNPTPSPLKAIVIYDGTFTKNAFDSMTQPLQGFYQTAASPSARLTQIVGDGRSYLSERVRLNGQIIATNPFVSALGDKWDNKTLNIGLPAGAASASVKVEPNGLLSDCLSYSAMVLSTTVQDTDDDGLLDVWETSPALTDPSGVPLPNLAAMGASPYRKDLFVEVGYMTTSGSALGYGGVGKPAHTHLPAYEAVKMVGDAHKNAPIPNPDGSTGISLHVDVGPHYQDTTDGYIIRVDQGARGGEALDERTTVCTPDPDAPWVCQFAGYPGTVGWLSGFRFIKDELLAPAYPADPGASEDFCDANPASPSCVRRFDANRRDIFRYTFFAHALGVPKEDCLVDGFPDDACQTSNPLYHVPVTNTGIGNFPGPYSLITLGGFDDPGGLPIGSPYWQATTWMHELGHNGERGHGGDAGEPNCKPLYLSVMNYLYQLRGLQTDTARRVDYSRDELPATDETLLSDGTPGTLPYRPAWYAPQNANTIGSPATRFCNGAAFPSPLPAGWVEMVRVDSEQVADAIDWNADLDPTDSSFTQDVNFDGVFSGSLLGTPPLGGSNDWEKLRLNQLGGSRNIGGWFSEIDGFYMGPLSLNVGRGDLGRGDLGRGDLGRGDLGRGDLGRGDLGRGDLGRGDLGRGDLGRGDLGRGDLGRGDLGRGDLGQGDAAVGGPGDPFGEIDQETASALGNMPPRNLTACVLGIGCAGTPHHRIRLTWEPPDLGSATRYFVYRKGPASTVLVGQVPAAVGVTSYSLVDTEELPNGMLFTYYVLAEFVDDDGNATTPPPVSGASNKVTIAAVNDAPIAENDAYSTNEDTALVVGAAAGVLLSDTDVDSPAASLRATVVSAPAHGTLTLNANGSFTYTPHANYNGADSFTYKGFDACALAAVCSPYSAPATVSLTIYSVNDPPAGTDKTVTTKKNTSFTVTASVFGFTDPLDAPPNAFYKVKITSLPSSSVGTLKLNGYAITTGTRIPKADLDAGKLKFVPKSYTTGTTSFRFQLQDDGGTERGGIDTDASADCVTVKVVHDSW